MFVVVGIYNVSAAAPAHPGARRFRGGEDRYQFFGAVGVYSGEEVASTQHAPLRAVSTLRVETFGIILI